MVGAGGVDAVLIADNLPELGTNLVTALTSLDMNDLTHASFDLFSTRPASVPLRVIIIVARVPSKSSTFRFVAENIFSTLCRLTGIRDH